VNDQEILQKLVGMLTAAAIPPKLRWLDAEGVGAMLGYSAQHVRERLACKPGFPKPSRPFGGQPRWRASEIDAWMESQRKAA
jgi:predicted DNA-binding transcriptional regulator AlpA